MTSTPGPQQATTPARAASTAVRLAVAAALLAGTLALGVVFAGQRTASGFDAAAAGVVENWPALLLRVLVLPTEPPVVLAAMTLTALVCALRRRWAAAAFVLAAPALAVAVNTWLLKPAFGRVYDDHLAYPSGHTVSLVSVLTVLAVLARGATRAAVAAAGAALTVLAGAGMVGLGYHYLTDVAGGAAFATATALALSAAPTVRRRRRGPAP